ncbi:hypothetical protein NQ315_001861 [Exocentrus adspersus]|uniref:Coiled-coil domain-containing protein 137 n=1 Tax=Exocentrus adspersus TaxID=1586481 RepID=A0AAV8W9P5_9CUCU|nr:hypothetical protein NQ315_001861 [Exocentrus adspersus]
MGRKIPGRKHRGVRDPEKQAAVRLESIKNKINAPPTNPDFQEVSKTLQRVIDLKDKVKSGHFKVLKKKKKPAQEPNKIKNDDTKNTEFLQLPNESNKEYLNRVNKFCRNVTKEAEFENKYGVDIKRNEAGEVSIVKRPQDELEVLIKKAKKEKKTKKIKKKKVANASPKLTKSQKWALKKKEKKLKKKKVDNSENVDNFESARDTVKFGEVVHAPPTLTVPKKIQQVLPKTPGQKNLLLSSLLSKNNQKAKLKDNKEKSAISKKTIDKKGKRKQLPMGLRRQLDKQQKDIVEAYKLLKAKKKTV